jgi:hypothetical protein
MGFGLGKSLEVVREVNVAAATPPPFAMLFEGLTQVGAGPTSPNNTDVMLDVQAALLTDDDSLGIVITDAEFRIVVYCATSGAAGNTMTGRVVVVEQISPEALANFL